MNSAPVTLLERLLAFDTTSRESNLALIGFIEDYLASQGSPPACFITRIAARPTCWRASGPRATGA